MLLCYLVIITLISKIKIMEIKLEYDKNYGYTATIKEFWIVTEWDNFDELIKNITEAINLVE